MNLLPVFLGRSKISKFLILKSNLNFHTAGLTQNFFHDAGSNSLKILVGAQGLEPRIHRL